MDLYCAHTTASFTAISLPPLWERVRVGGLPAPRVQPRTAHVPDRGDRPPTSILPHKGGGDRNWQRLLFYALPRATIIIGVNENRTGAHQRLFNTRHPPVRFAARSLPR